jgi:hypothetical protein
MDKATNGLRPQHQIPQGAGARGAPRRRRKSLRQHFCDGIEAAVKAEPAAFAATKPRTMMGQMVQELVRIAATGRCGQIKLVASFLEEAEARRNAQIEDLDDSQGISAPEAPPEPKWDWDEDGIWDSSERESEEAGAEEPKRELPGDPSGLAGIMRVASEGGRRRIAEADHPIRDYRAPLAAEAAGGKPAVAPISGNYPASPPQGHAAGTMRVGGRRVDG